MEAKPKTHPAVATFPPGARAEVWSYDLGNGRREYHAQIRRDSTVYAARFTVRQRRTVAKEKKG